MKFTEICLVITAAVSVFLLCANIFLIIRHLSTKKKHEAEKRRISLLLSTTAHDLRSPLAGIKGFADAMLEGTVDEDCRGAYLAVISSETDRLARLSSRLCEGDHIRLSPRNFGLCETVRRAYLIVERKAKSRGLEVEFSFSDEDEFYVHADSDAVFEIVLNLFENAVKYCSDKGRIIWTASNDGGLVRLSVRNTTDSLPDIPDIFAEGAQADTKRRDGFGLGLYISKKLAQKSGTDLVFEKGTDERGAFCAFSIKLPSSDEI